MYYKHVFVVLVYKNTEVLNGFFQSLKEKVQNYKVILVNSFYDEPSKQACQEYAAKNACDFIDIPNKGYGAGNNVGIKYAMEHYGFDFLIISNSDIIIKKLDALDKYLGKPCIVGTETIMLTGKRQNPCLGRYPTLNSLYFMLCRKGYEKDSHLLITMAHACSRLNKIFTWLQLFFSRKRELQVLAIHGSFFVMTKAAVEAMFPVFNDEMFLYNEELYLGLRAKQRGVPIYYSKDNIVNHLEGASSSGDFWKQYPHFKESFTLLNKYMENGFFCNQKMDKKRQGFRKLREALKVWGG